MPAPPCPALPPPPPSALAADDEPLRRVVTRTQSLTKEDFERLLNHTGLFNVGACDAEPRSERSHLPPSKLDAPARRPRRSSRTRARLLTYSCLRLPMVRPDNKWYVVWSSIVLVADLTYSAFIVPISIGMWTSFFVANWTTICDFLFGAVFFTGVERGSDVRVLAQVAAWGHCLSAAVAAV